jgi:hypothetical protein
MAAGPRCVASARTEQKPAWFQRTGGVGRNEILLLDWALAPPGKPGRLGHAWREHLSLRLRTRNWAV